MVSGGKLGVSLEGMLGNFRGRGVFSVFLGWGLWNVAWVCKEFRILRFGDTRGD